MIDTENYKKSVEDFKKHLDSLLPDESDESDESDDSWEAFYSLPVAITFGDKTVQLENEATVYYMLSDFIEHILKHCV